MKIIGMQPSFTLDVPLDSQQLQQRIRRVVNDERYRETSSAAGSCADFRVEKSQQRIWSPHLGVQMSPLESGTRLHCRFSPRPEIWTFIMMIYFGMVIVAFGAAVYGYVQWIMGESPWALLGVPLGLGTIGVLHGISLVGQSWSADQMEDLERRMRAAFDEAALKS
ncbi:MAG: hypothetical protein AAF958_01095 [Planctomycetota bacterium]